MSCAPRPMMSSIAGSSGRPRVSYPSSKPLDLTRGTTAPFARWFAPQSSRSDGWPAGPRHETKRSHMLEAVDDDLVFKALADPTRRLLLDLLFERDGRTLTELESGIEMSRFGVAKH